MIYSFTPFLNELDILELRLSYLDPIIDKHVIIEFNRTNTDIPKSYNFLENKDRFSKYLDKIEYMPVEFPWPDTVNTNAWVRDYYMRSQLAESETWRNMQDNDFAMIMDLDEIPHRETVQYIMENKLADRWPVQLSCLMCHHFINLVEMPNYGEQPWQAIVIVPGHMKHLNPNPAQDHTAAQYFRTQRHSGQWHKVATPRSFQGWHFTYFGGVERLQYKIASMAHQEHNIPAVTNSARLEQCIKNAITIQGRQLAKIKLDNYPQEIIDWARKYGHIC